MEDVELAHRIAFNRTRIFGPVRFDQMLRMFGSATRGWEEVSRSDLAKFGIGEGVGARFLDLHRKMNVRREFERARQVCDRILTCEDPDYPQNLLEISDPPYILYVRGKLLERDSKAVTVVGSRRMTNYGRQVVENLIAELAAAGLTIVSGLAFGVDAAAHRAALGVGGRTLAVLASGVDVITPRTHQPLAEQILSSGQGAIISEVPVGSGLDRDDPVFKSAFPVRNRIVAGLSLGVLIIEAAEKSGTMHTVNAALEQGREVFAVPGPIFSTISRGTNKLIQDGAKLVQGVEDVLNELPPFAKASEGGRLMDQGEVETAEEKKVLEAVGEGEKHIDQIVRESGLLAAQVSSILLSLELKSLVKNTGANTFRKV